MRVALCIPVYNDWTSAIELLGLLDAAAEGRSETWEVFFVDDGSNQPPPAALVTAPAHLKGVFVLRLRRNLGHQRAIAIGIAYLYEQHTHDALVVLDGDGEDRPEDIPRLLDRMTALGATQVVFAQRTKRTEGFVFRLGFLAFRALHKLLVGRKVEVGNFSVIPRSALERLVAVGETWNHYAAAVYHARLPVDLVPAPRGRRIAGKSQMNFTSLVVHGLSAISVYSETVGVRLLVLLAIAGALVTTGLGAVVLIRFATSLAIPGWATTAAGILLVGLLNLTLISMLMVLFILRSRTEYGFLPIRDYRHFVIDLRSWFPSRS